LKYESPFWHISVHSGHIGKTNYIITKLDNFNFSYLMNGTTDFNSWWLKMFLYGRSMRWKYFKKFNSNFKNHLASLNMVQISIRCFFLEHRYIYMVQISIQFLEQMYYVSLWILCNLHLNLGKMARSTTIAWNVQFWRKKSPTNVKISFWHISVHGGHIGKTNYIIRQI
jgi:hypothetical protein